ncbi:unnamed protein product [Owenia fusiformis]|uniref:Uncharacterized protein n=1 Tax=Owenia fusiformis TaxID=6347 RepID=A0A8J1UDC9_OWEFU|nr:unnamed protein product [Owenia fusiformis]
MKKKSLKMSRRKSANHLRMSQHMRVFEMAICLSLVCSATALAEPEISPRLISEFKVTYPSFIAAYDNLNKDQNDGNFTLIISSFDPIPWNSDHIYYVTDIDKVISENITNINVQTLTDKVTWPNEIEPVPIPGFGKDSIAVPGGFLVPGKQDGAVNIFDLNPGTILRNSVGPFDISTPKGGADKDWFFHRVLWKDMNKDGLPDAVTCRGRKPIFGSTEGNLLWLENPRDSPYNFSRPWTEHIVASGPDNMFTLAEMTADGVMYDVIITSSYFSENLTIYWSPSGEWEKSKVKQNVIATKLGQMFDVQVMDLNRDGRLDLLVSLNAYENGKVLAFEVPIDFRSGKYVMHTLATGFSSKSWGPGKGSPGSSKAFFPNTKNESGKPLILVSGDDDGSAHILYPKSLDLNNWEYETKTFLEDGDGTIGGIAIADIDKDGYKELFVPSYSKDRVFVYSFKPKMSQIRQTSVTTAPKGTSSTPSSPSWKPIKDPDELILG